MNKETAIANANLNRINQYTPQGAITFQQIGTNPDGTPQYQSNQTYSPEQQQLYQGQTAVSNALTDTAGKALTDVNAAYAQPYNTSNIPGIQYGAQGGPIQSSYAPGGNIQSNLDFSNLSSLPGINDFSGDAQKARDTAYAAATSRLDPQYDQEQRQLAASLAGKGVSENSVAYRNAMDQFARQKTDAYNQANYGSYAAGGAEQSRLFGLALSGRQEGAAETEAAGQFANTAQAQQNAQNQGAAAFANTAQGQQFGQNLQNSTFGNQARAQAVQEYNQQRNEPINRIGTLLGTAGGVQNPNFANYSPVNVANTNYSGLVEDQYAQQSQNYQQQLQTQGSALGSLFGLGGALASKLKPFSFSDRRLKTNIVPIGELANGIKTYVFNYLWSEKPEFGVMADEVINIIPDAVIANDNGYMMVDYRKVW
jgi:hypothetical protein